MVDGIESGNSIEVHQEREWRVLPIEIVGIGEGEIDVAVLASEIRLAPSFTLIPTSAQLVYGQSVFFLGYPFGWDSGGDEINRGIPVPFVKAGTVSAFKFGDVNKIYLDAHGNSGFSGGPVVFAPSEHARSELRVAGIISHYPTPRSSWQSVVDCNGNPITDSNGDPIGFVQENPGIVVAIGIRHAIELINTNPIGFPLTVVDPHGQTSA